MSNAVENPTAAAYAPPAEDLSAHQTRAWIVGGVAAAVSVVGWLMDPTQFYRSYLVAWLFWLSIAAGCLGILALQHLTGGAWGLMVRRVLEAATRTLPFLALLFIPVVIGIKEIYVWAGPEAAQDELIQHKLDYYLNPTAFTLRSLLYLAVWFLIAYALSRLSLKQDRIGDPELVRRMQMIAAPGLGIYCLLTTFAAIDWIMSLDPHWYSSIFGIYFLGGQVIAALAFAILVSLYLSQREPMSEALEPAHFHDLGKLLLAFVMLWTYFALSQLLIIWSGHLPEGITWYFQRGQGGWKWISIALALFHFALPFFLLLSRDLKRNARLLARVAVLLLLMRWLDLYWLAAPSFHHSQGAFHWLDLTTVLAVGGVWIAIYLGELKSRPLLPVNDPYLDEALAHD